MRIIISNCTGLGNMILKGKMIDYLYKNDFKEIILLSDERWGYSELLKKDRRNLIIKNIKISFHFNSILEILGINNFKKKDIVLLPFDSSPLYVAVIFSIFFTGKIYMHKSNKKTFSTIIYFFLLRLFRIGRHLRLIKVKKGAHEEELNLDLIREFVNLKKNSINIKRGLLIKSTFNKSKKKNIIIQAGAKNGENTPKIWDPKKFKNLITFINLNYEEYEVIMVGDKNERSYINKMIKGTKARNDSGKSSVSEFYRKVILADLVICHDSSAMHIADTNNIPCIALLGPTDFSRTGPLSHNTIPIVSVNQSTMYMYNLEENEETTIKRYGTKYCMENINFDMVKAALKIFLEK